MSVSKYPVTLRALHWLLALIIIGDLVVGLYMAGIDPDAADKYALYPWHKQLGFLALLLVLIRLPVRLRGPIPAAPAGLMSWEVVASHLVHRLLYLSMLVMPLSGYLMNSTFPYAEGMAFFGLFTVPDITGKSEFWNGIFHSVHSAAAWVLIASLVLHIAGALKHRYLDAPENDVLGRML